MVSIKISGGGEEHEFDEAEFSKETEIVLSARFVLLIFKTVDDLFGDEVIENGELVAFSSFLRTALLQMLRNFGEGVPERAYRRAMTDVYLDEIKNSRFSAEINLIFRTLESRAEYEPERKGFPVLGVITTVQKLMGFEALNILRSEVDALNAQPIAANTLAENIFPSHLVRALDLTGQLHSAQHYRFWRK